MKRPWLLVLSGLALALGGFAVLYGTRVAAYRALCQTTGYELAWIKKEFNLNEAEFGRVRQLHEAYKPICEEMCRRVDEKSRQLAKILETSTQMTPEIDRLLGESAQLRKECQFKMLQHFLEVSRAMPPDQGRRYLAWMHAQTLAPAHGSMLPRISDSRSHDGPRH